MLTRSKGTEARSPAEDLIPEAREHQRRRYLRSGVIAVISALLVAALIAAGVILFAGPSTGGRSSVVRPAVASVTKNPGVVLFRPVLCYAPPYEGPGTSASAPAPTCSTASQLSNQNLNVDPSPSSPQGYATNNVPADASLADVPSTRPSADKGYSTALLPGLKTAHNSTVQRYVLGPAQMSSGAIASASVSNRGGQWVVDYTTTGPGAPQWDTVANENFHRLIAVVLNGVVYSAPIIQPSQSGFTSFEGRGEIADGLTKAEAYRLAAAMPYPR